MSADSTVENTLTQFSLINKLRNDILHYGCTFISDREEWLVTNSSFAHISSRRWEYYLPVAALEAAKNDLTYISMQIVTYLFELYGEPADARMYASVHGYAWQYKPPRQLGSPDRTPKTRLSPRHRHRALTK